jgi:hypothetical protein
MRRIALVARTKSFQSFFSRETERDPTIKNRPVVHYGLGSQSIESRPFGAEKCSKRFWYGLLAITLFFAPISASCVEHLHALIACDTFSNLKAEVINNKTNLLKTLETIAAQTGMSLHVTVLTGADLTDRAVFSWLDQVRKTPDSVALFSYSGHGFRTSNYTEAIPFLFFTRDTHEFRTDQFYHRLESTGARLSIMLLDCCNNVTSHGLRRRPKSPMGYSFPGMKKLFLETQGTIVLMGAAPGGTSWYFHGKGGLFTSMFIRSLFEETQNENASWKRLFEKTYRYCAEHQRPLSLLNISSTAMDVGLRSP